MSFTNSNKEFCGVQKLGDGRYAADFEVYVADVESTRLFKASIKKVPDDENYRRAASEFALTLPTLTKNTCIGTSDGVPIIYFIKQGMTSRWGSLTTTLLALALAAIQMVLSIYPPPKNLKANLRHKGNLEAELAKSEALGRPYGVFHWMYWVPQAQRKPMVSRPTTGVNPSRLAALKKFFAFTRSEHYRISMWLKALDPQGWQRYNQCYQKARAGGKLEILDDGAWGIQSCHTLLVNAIANPHKDPGDVKQGWTITYPLGNFTGGEVVFLDLGLKFGQQAGDILMAPASVLTHMVLPHQGGDRYSHVWFTKADVMDPPEHKYFCNIGLCTVGYKQKAGLQTHWATKNEPYHEAARQRRAAGKAVASDNAMEYRGDDYDEDDLDDAGSDASEYGFGVDTGETEATTSDRPTKRQKVTKETLESLALPEGAPTDTRQRYWCDVPGCAKSQASGSEGYTAKATVAKHKRAKHAEEADVADVGSS